MPGGKPMPGGAPMQPNQPQLGAATAEGGAASQGKLGPSENEAPKDGPVEVVEAQTDNDSRVPGGRDGDTDAAPIGAPKSPWVTSLPKSVQQAIKSRTKRTLPAGYEERLKKYFNSIK